MRDRLKSLIDTFFASVDIDKFYSQNQKEKLSDYLLANSVIVPPYKPFPVVLSEDENNSDVFCPFCDTDLSGNYYGGDYEPPKIVTCFGCGTWLDGTKAITKEEAVQALKGNVPDTNVGNKIEKGGEG